jgi:hypothetical protein
MNSSDDLHAKHDAVPHSWEWFSYPLVKPDTVSAVCVSVCVACSPRAWQELLTPGNVETLFQAAWHHVEVCCSPTADYPSCLVSRRS